MTAQEAITELLTDKLCLMAVSSHPSLVNVEEIDIAIEALEKQIPKKPKGDYHSVPHYRCPSCNSAVKVFEDAHEYHWCLYCGQALDWSDNNE